MKRENVSKQIILATIIILGFQSFLFSQVNNQKPKVRATITYCNLALPEKWKLANLSFNSLYSFSVDDKGEVVDTQKVRDSFIGDEQVKECLAEWKITGFPHGSTFLVYFVWKHSEGWIRQEISGNGFSQITTMRDIGLEKIIP